MYTRQRFLVPIFPVRMEGISCLGATSTMLSEEATSFSGLQPLHGERFKLGLLLEGTSCRPRSSSGITISSEFVVALHHVLALDLTRLIESKYSGFHLRSNIPCCMGPPVPWKCWYKSKAQFAVLSKTQFHTQHGKFECK